MKRLFLALVFAACLLRSAAAAPAAEIAVSPGDLIIDLSVQAELGNYRCNTKMAVAIKDDKTATMAVNSDDPKNPVHCKVTVHARLQPGGTRVQLRLTLEIRANGEGLTRSIDVMTPLGMEGLMQDARENPHEKLELHWKVHIR